MYIQTALRMAAKKGVGFLFSATKNGLSALSVTVGKAKKSYSNNHERGVLSELRNRGLPPQDLIFEGSFLKTMAIPLAFLHFFSAHF
jgi:hypothetical protein